MNLKNVQMQNVLIVGGWIRILDFQGPNTQYYHATLTNISTYSFKLGGIVIAFREEVGFVLQEFSKTFPVKFQLHSPKREHH